MNTKIRLLQLGMRQANNKLVINRAKYTTLIASGYMCGNAVSYSSKSNQNLDDLNEWLENAEAATQDMDVATDQSIFGVAYELAYSLTKAVLRYSERLSLKTLHSSHVSLR